MTGKSDSIVPIKRVDKAILQIRGQRVVIDADLAALYGVTTKRLNEQVKRNRDRFPPDFMFRLDKMEFEALKSQFATSSSEWGGRRKLPYAFTEHGAIMAASVLNSPKAIEMSILVVRAFVKLRSVLASHGPLAAKLNELERKLTTHDRQIGVLFDAIRKLMAPPDTKKRRIGFTT
ncbi:MAG: ORF6N domain-containing protein [Deltaproteobacteria bacterium]|nr:ORF6N domain-containing protein [Deltaproteobacteria bacterium]